MQGPAPGSLEGPVLRLHGRSQARHLRAAWLSLFVERSGR